jgi:magnesium transporter
MWDPALLDRYGVSSAAALLALFSRAAGRQILPLIDELEERIDGLEDLAFEGDPRTLTEAHILRRELITLRRIVGRQRDIMEYLSTSVNEVVAGDQTAFMIATENAGRLVDALESGRGLLGSVLDTYRGAVADQTNEIIRLLTVFSAILLPLTLIAGILGMNFDFIPTADQEWGFWGSVAGMAVIAIGLWIYFATRGFVGRPRLRELPKAVGLGLIQVGTAPVRALASGVGSTLQHLDPRKGSSDPKE